jgi:hypothetical protein
VLSRIAVGGAAYQIPLERNIARLNMSYMDEWRALSARLKGLESAARLHLMIRNVEKTDSDPRTKEDLFPVCQAIFAALRDFQAAHAAHLPASARKYLEEFFNVSKTYFAETKSYSPTSVYKSLIRLTAFDAEMAYLLTDTQEQIRSRAELAFAHLQNLIYVDPATRRAWSEAFKDGEPACERLGKVHLLLHGILGLRLTAKPAGGQT